MTFASEILKTAEMSRNDTASNNRASPGMAGKLIAVCDYAASYTPGGAVWNEGYPVWWHLTNVRLLSEPIPCRAVGASGCGD